MSNVEKVREELFGIFTEPPWIYECYYGRIYYNILNYDDCEFWDTQGHYCFLKDAKANISKCKLAEGTPKWEVKKKEWNEKERI